MEIGFYRHYKSKEIYQVIGTVICKSSNTEFDGEPMIEYLDSSGKKYVRRYSEFTEMILVDENDENPVRRFEFIGKDKPNS